MPIAPPCTVALLVVVTATHLPGCARPEARKPLGHAGLALWSFIISTTHGTGVMLVPALMPFCAGGISAGKITVANSLLPAIGAIGVHTAAMLAVCGLVAAGFSRVLDAGVHLLSGARRNRRQASGPR